MTRRPFSRRLVCRLRGHRWTPWLQRKQWRYFDDTGEYWYRNCLRCPHYEAQEAKP